MSAQLERLAIAAEYRHQTLLWHVQAIHAQINQPPPGNHGWLKLPLALALPVAIFLLMLAITGDPRTALKAAAGVGGG
jgi:hypothetical protein